MTHAYYSSDACDLESFTRLINQNTRADDVPLAKTIINNIPIYDMKALHPMLADASKRQTLMAEWARVMNQGAGAIALQNAYSDTTALDRATEIYMQIIADEKASGLSSADHFAAGTNDRVWNSLQKLCLKDPAVFASVFSCPAIDAAAEAWLGPNYQMTAQVNLVRPGGAAQQAHRDYHLGFQTEDQAAAYPAHVHHLSPFMTLQGAIAHVDMPIESGPTKLLPFSQSYGPGYMAYRLPEFRAHFEENYIQIPLKKGDALFFNPALFHAGGENRTDNVLRFANLVQIGSAMGRVLENIDRTAMCKALYPTLQNLNLPQDAENAAIAACAEGYPFPTNLDTDPPIGGLAPESQAALMRRAIKENMTPSAFNKALDDQNIKQRA